MSWSSFKNAFDELLWISAQTRELTPEQVKSVRNAAVRGLQNLAHMDVVEIASALEVRVGPAVLVRLPVAGLPQAVLAGWRSPSLLRELEEFSRDLRIEYDYEVLDQGPLLPVRCRVTAENEEQLGALATRLSITPALRPPAWGFAALGPSLVEYLASLEWGEVRDVPRGAMVFNPFELRLSCTNSLNVRRNAFIASVEGPPCRTARNGPPSS